MKNIITAIVETPKGSRNKYKYDEKKLSFKLKKVLPEGMFFPYNFGFIPNTKADDGDPVDILILMDEPAFTGCMIDVKVIGMIEAKQKEKKAPVETNNRLIGVAAESQLYKSIESINDLEKNLLDEIEHFFISYSEVAGKKFIPIGRVSPKKALKYLSKTKNGKR